MGWSPERITGRMERDTACAPSPSIGTYLARPVGVRVFPSSCRANRAACDGRGMPAARARGNVPVDVELLGVKGGVALPEP